MASDPASQENCADNFCLVDLLAVSSGDPNAATNLAIFQTNHRYGDLEPFAEQHKRRFRTCPYDGRFALHWRFQRNSLGQFLPEHRTVDLHRDVKRQTLATVVANQTSFHRMLAPGSDRNEIQVGIFVA